MKRCHQSFATQSVFFDYDRDGFVDLFVMNHPPNRGSYSPFSGQDLIQPKYSSRLYRNINNEFFEDVTVEANLLRTGYPSSAIASDLNNDGWPDLYVTNDFDVPEFLYINNGNGTFSYQTEKALRHTSFYSMGIDAADINNDGWIDLIAGTGNIILNNGDGTFQNSSYDLLQGYTGGMDWYSQSAIDLNNDGIDEVITYVSGNLVCGSSGCQSYILQGKEKDWKAIHTHTSAPWIMQQEGEAFPIEEVQEKILKHFTTLFEVDSVI